MSRSIIILLAGLAILSTVTCAKPTCNRPNEEYQCGSACQTTCSNLGQTCPIINIKCNDACYCKEGYARRTNDNSPCIPKADCP
ncbi:PREDICTED: inducible metalloproteinase inhibitor protein-like [Vollenhovia emeryi]|uniref:inducible metalloproteinase inhibitor protein-like n=1 Tax=Vollenhovia emeryi TaxID=411798 RepID=UPI0005F52BA9|nr:PREDICTED: inducible metalloproteinase inhibitor protein-like [Vollenhovia emeryi]